MWEKIFGEFLPASSYKMIEQADLEYYYKNNKNIFCELWVPVERK
ncbi:effector binding domain-containing protein [Fusobacterium varium]|jgi:AraC family transcriptional regulator|nr:effector binding domain-containing protein [Fusobacterium varium]